MSLVIRASSSELRKVVDIEEGRDQGEVWFRLWFISEVRAKMEYVNALFRELKSYTTSTDGIREGGRRRGVSFLSNIFVSRHIIYTPLHIHIYTLPAITPSISPKFSSSKPPHPLASSPL